MNNINLQIDAAARQVSQNGKAVYLTQTELALLLYLLDNAGRITTRPELLAQVWGITAPVHTRTVDIPIGQTLSSLSPRSTPCKQLSLHTAFHGISFSLLIDHNVVMDMTFINVSCYYILILSARVFKCQFLPQLMGLLRRDSVLRRKGLYQVIGKICRTLPFQVPRFVRKHRGHFKVDRSCLRLAIIA